MTIENDAKETPKLPLIRGKKADGTVEDFYSFEEYHAAQAEKAKEMANYVPKPWQSAGKRSIKAAEEAASKPQPKRKVRDAMSTKGMISAAKVISEEAKALKKGKE